MPKTNAEMCRQYRRKKNENKIKIKKKTGKSSTERSREYRARKKQLMNNRTGFSNISVNVPENGLSGRSSAGEGLATHWRGQLDAGLEKMTEQAGRPAVHSAYIVIDSIVIKREKPDEAIDEPEEDGNTLCKQEPLDGTEISHNIHDSLFEVLKHEVSCDSLETEHWYEPDVATSVTCKPKTDWHVAERWPAESPVAQDTSVAMITVEVSKMEEVSSVKLNTKTQELANIVENIEIKEESASEDKLSVEKHSSCAAGTLPDKAQKSGKYCDSTRRHAGEQPHAHAHGGQEPYACSQCDFRSSSAGCLKTHTRTHTTEKLVSCDFCDYKSKNSGALHVHVRSHTGEKPYACAQCDYRSTNPGALRVHARTHSGEKPYACAQCQYRCKTLSALVAHRRTHTGDKPISCELCDYRCCRWRSLRAHMRRHGGARPLACALCDYTCVTSRTLKSHMVSHSDATPYACALCSYSSHSAHAARAHAARHAAGAHACGACPATFARASQLKTHSALHAGEPVLACTLCDYTCTNASTLRGHRRKHTAEKRVLKPT